MQSILPGEIEPAVCLHPLGKGGAWPGQSMKSGKGQQRLSHFPCDACLWCFKNEAWDKRACFKKGVCPLKERKRVSTWGKEYEAWLIRARRKIMLARLTRRRRKAKSQSTDSEASQTLPAE